jgi:molybdenum cofactor biosynthesis enzyme MoaA
MVSHGCSNRCVFCLEDGGLRRTADFGDPLRIMETFGERDAVLFTCGEPTLNPALVDWIDRARELGYREIELVTNGRRLADPDYARALLEAGLTGVTVSIHAHRPEVHNRITGRRSFLQSLAGLQNLIQLKKQPQTHQRRTAEESRSLDVRLNTVICRLNLPDLTATVAFFRAQGPDVINLNFIEPLGRAERRFDALVPKMSTVATEISHLPKPDLDAETLREIVVTGMPPCVLPARWVQSGRRETIFMWDGHAFVELKANRRQIFGPPCAACRWRPRCDGVWKRYIEKHGWAEFGECPDA